MGVVNLFCHLRVIYRKLEELLTWFLRYATKALSMVHPCLNAPEQHRSLSVSAWSGGRSRDFGLLCLPTTRFRTEPMELQKSQDTSLGMQILNRWKRRPYHVYIRSDATCRCRLYSETAITSAMEGRRNNPT